ncbi:hypothetical protein FGRMN_5882 [Fusarium graminum]|nr:hypothetical protein FGRMN_5882 [Fusarium graminum]
MPSFGGEVTLAITQTAKTFVKSLFAYYKNKKFLANHHRDFPHFIAIPKNGNCSCRFVTHHWLASRAACITDLSESAILQWACFADMSLTNFDLFPNFPTELRLKILKTACRTIPSGHRGIHYVEVTPGSSIHAISSHWDDNRNNSDNIIVSTHPSAYLWDAGLWLANKESREVISKHVAAKKWFRPVSDFANLDTSNEDGDNENHEEDDEGDEEDFVSSPVGIVTVANRERWPMMTFPQRDIFCVQFQNVQSLPPMVLDLKIDKYYDIYRSYVSGGSFGTSPIHVDGVALEFHPDWNVAFPSTMSELLSEYSTRGLLAGWLKEAAMADAFEHQPWIWLIDRTANWKATSQLLPHTAYYDCNDKYTEIDWLDEEGTQTSPVGNFIEMLRVTCETSFHNLWARDPHNGMMLQNCGERFTMESLLRVLVLECNKIVE